MKIALLSLAAVAALTMTAQSAEAARSKVRPSDELNRQQLARYQEDMAAQQTATDAWGTNATPTAQTAPSVSYATPAPNNTAMPADTQEQPAVDPADLPGAPGNSPAIDSSAAQLEMGKTQQ